MKLDLLDAVAVPAVSGGAVPVANADLLPALDSIANSKRSARRGEVGTAIAKLTAHRVAEAVLGNSAAVARAGVRADADVHTDVAAVGAIVARSFR